VLLMIPLLLHLQTKFESQNMLLVTQCIVCHEKNDGLRAKDKGGMLTRKFRDLKSVK
jgi:hypothetical protein